MYRVWPIVGLIVAGLGGLAHAGPFAQVPQGDPAYAAYSRLAAARLLGVPTADTAMKSALTRYEFALAIERPLRQLGALEQCRRGGSDAGCQQAQGLEETLAGASDQQLSQAAGDLRLLATAFGGELAALDLKPESVESALTLLTHPAELRKLMAALLGPAVPPPDQPPARSSATPITAAPGSRPLLSPRNEASTLRVSAPAALHSGGPLRYLPAGPADSRNSTFMWLLGYGNDPGPSLQATRELLLRPVRGGVEYGLTDSLTISLGYEALLRQGRGAAPSDSAALRTLGVGYRFTPSTSLSLRYHFMSYSDPLLAATRPPSRLGEAELTIRF